MAVPDFQSFFKPLLGIAANGKEHSMKEARELGSYDILCKKLIMDGLYTAATVILSPRTATKTGRYAEMSDMTGLESFVTTLAGHIAVEASISQRK